MSERKRCAPYSISGMVFTAITIILGALFILQALSVYFDGLEAKEIAKNNAAILAQESGYTEEQTQLATAAAAEAVPIYSREIASRRLIRLTPYVCVWLAALIADIAITARFKPKQSSAAKPKLTSHASEVMLAEKLRSAKAKLPSSPRLGKDEEYLTAYSEFQSIEKRSRQLMLTVFAISAICLLIPFIYFADFSHFPNEALNREVIHAVLFALPFITVLLIAASLYVSVRQRLIKNEFDAIKAAIRSGELNEPPQTQTKASARARTVTRIALFAVGTVLLVIGTQNGSMQDVFIKATKICTECIGLG